MFIILTMSPLAAAADHPWPNWRGPNASGSAPSGPYPAHFDASTLRWKTALPGKGCSTPAVWDDRIYLTAPTNGMDAVLAIDLSGRILWQTTFGPEVAGKHRNGSGSNPSPVTDGQSVFVSFKSGTLAAVSLDGRVRWATNLVEAFGQEKLFWDLGNSPTLTREAVVIARMHGGDSWIAAFEKATGALRWKVARNYETPTEVDNAYTTPLLIAHQGREALLTWGAQHLTAHDATDGRLLWSCGDFNPEANGFWPAVATPVVVGDIAVVPFGRSDRGQPRLHGIRLGGTGDVTATHRAWLREDTGTFVPTPAADRGQVYLLRDRGEVECLEAATGRTLWKDALPRDRSNYYASPLVAGDRLYAAREDGKVFVAKVDEAGFELLAENDLGERVIASPVAAANRLFIRGDQHLFCLTTAPIPR